jgi:hypothetical protein
MKHKVPMPAKVLGTLGLIPFFISLFSSFHITLDTLLSNTININSAHLQLNYSIIILCFMAGSFWGFSANAKVQKPFLYIISVLPTLYILGTLLFPSQYQFIIIGIGFAFLLPIDIYFKLLGMAPLWWLRLRIPLTLTVIIILTLFQFRFFIATMFGNNFG